MPLFGQVCWLRKGPPPPPPRGPPPPPPWKGDTEGNLVYRKTARNFNPNMATAAKLTIAEVEHLVEPGELDPDAIATPGVYVQRIVHAPETVKRIEQRTVRKRDAA